jgi:uncharacterized alkaline shock family protein YloU
LQIDRGKTTINDAVVTSIASTAVREVSGAEPEVDAGSGGGRIPGDNPPTMGELFGRVTRGVSVEVGETQAAIDLTVTAPYGRSVPEVTNSVRDNVVQRVEGLTGLEVTEVNITVRTSTSPISSSRNGAAGTSRLPEKIRVYSLPGTSSGRRCPETSRARPGSGSGGSPARRGTSPATNRRPEGR